MNPELLRVAVARGFSGTLQLLALSDETGLPLHVPADAYVKSDAAKHLRTLLMPATAFPNADRLPTYRDGD